MAETAKGTQDAALDLHTFSQQIMPPLSPVSGLCSSKRGGLSFSSSCPPALLLYLSIKDVRRSLCSLAASLFQSVARLGALVEFVGERVLLCDVSPLLFCFSNFSTIFPSRLWLGLDFSTIFFNFQISRLFAPFFCLGSARQSGIITKQYNVISGLRLVGGL